MSTLEFNVGEEMKTIAQLEQELDAAQHEHQKAIGHRQWAAKKAEQTFGGEEEQRWQIELDKALTAERDSERVAKRALAAHQKARA